MKLIFENIEYLFQLLNNDIDDWCEMCIQDTYIKKITKYKQSVRKLLLYILAYKSRNFGQIFALKVGGRLIGRS